jgi:hypothetical protein
MTPDFIIALVRTALQMIGAGLAAKGYVGEDDWTAISGGLIASISVGWMLWARWNTKKVAAS